MLGDYEFIEIILKLVILIIKILVSDDYVEILELVYKLNVFGSGSVGFVYLEVCNVLVNILVMVISLMEVCVNDDNVEEIYYELVVF